MKTIFQILLIINLSSYILIAQTNITGKVLSMEENKPLQNVSVIIPELFIRTETNSNGNYTFNNISNGSYVIKFVRLGYKEKEEKIAVKNNKNLILNVALKTSPIELGEAKVISSRTNRLIKEIPIPIEFIDSKKINKGINITVAGLMNNEPGITISKDSPWSTAINVRGLSKQNLVYLIDGNRIETSTNIAGGLSMFDLADIQSIEIVKGGLSSLYGSGATGGVVNIISKQISNSNKFYFNGVVTGAYSNVNQGTTNNILLRAGDKFWAVKISAGYRNAGDTETPSGKLVNSSFNDKNFSVAAAVYPFENLSVKINYQNFKAWDVGIPGGAPFPLKATAKYLNADRELISGIINIKNLMSGLTNTSLKIYRQVIGRDVELIPNPKVVVKPGATHYTNGALLKTEWIVNKNNYLIAGLDLWQREYNGYRTKTIKPLKKIIADKPVPDSKFRNAGLFLQDEIHLANKKLKFTLGGRYDFINITNKETNNPNYVLVNGNKIIPPANPLASYKESNINNKSFSGNFGVLYSLLNYVDFAFNAAYTFRSPSLEERFQFIDLGAIQYIGNPNLQPERGSFFDLGLRIWKEKFSFKLNGFINLFNNLVVDKIKIPDSLYQKENVGKAKLTGFDASLEYNFYKNYVIYLSAAYVEGKDIKQDEYLSQIPPFNGKIGFTIPIKNILNFNFSSTIFLTQNKVSKKETKKPGYTYFDISLNSKKFNFRKIAIQLFTGIENVFNKKYRNHLSTYRGISLVEPGRNIYAKLKISF